MEKSSPFQAFYAASPSNTAQEARQHQQQQKLAQLNQSGYVDHRLPASTAAQKQLAQSLPSSNTISAPPAYAAPPTQQQQQQVDTARPFTFADYRHTQSHPSNTFVTSINQPPTHYAIPQGQLLYFHCDSGAAPMPLGGQQQQQQPQMLMSPSAANVNIMQAGGSFLYPTMAVSSVSGSSPTVAYYVQTGMNPQQEQQQQHHQLSVTSADPAVPTGSANVRGSATVPTAQAGSSLYLLHPASQQQQYMMLNPPSSSAISPVPNVCSQNPPLSYFVVPTQQVNLNSVKTLTNYQRFPFASPSAVQMPTKSEAANTRAAYRAPPTPLTQSMAQQQQQQSAMALTVATAANWTTSPTSRYARPPPLQASPSVQSATSASNDNSVPVRSQGNEKPLSASLNSRSAPANGSGGDSKRSSCGVRRGHSSRNVDTNVPNNEASITSQSTTSTQGRPYAEDPVEIDTTKRQLIVNFLPQRLTDERFKDLFRPYGELMEEASHIIYDFRHHKVVPMPPPLTTEVPSSSVPHAASDSTPLSFDKEVSPVSAIGATTTTAITTLVTTSSNINITSPFSLSLARDDAEESTTSTANSNAASEATSALTTATNTATATRSMPRSKGYGFIYYKNGASTERAIKELNGKEVDGKRIKVRYAEQQRCLEPNPAAAAKEGPYDVDVQLCSAASDGDDDELKADLFDTGAFKVDDE